MATIRDIARHANVSIATVSRVLNNNTAVNESIRYAVLKSAEELNYPLQNLRSKLQINQSVLVLIRPNAADENDASGSIRDFEKMVWDSVHTVLDARGTATRFQQSGTSAEEARQYADDPSISGLILLGGIIQRDFAEELMKHEVPFVVAGSHLQPFPINAVMADVSMGIQAAATYLIERGRRRIALVNGPSTTMTSAEKLDGLRLTLAAHGQTLNPDYVVASDFSAENGYLMTGRLLDQAPDLDAILYADDTIALGGMRALRESGRSVPDDVAVVGFGNYTLAGYTNPPLTSVHFDTRLMGRIAAKRLCMLMDEPDGDAWLVRVPCTLVERGST